MRVAVASSAVPFVPGGASKIVADLVGALRERGHDVETILLPHGDDLDRTVDQLLAMRLLDVSHIGDRLIAIRPPSHLLRHPSKVVWMIHHDRRFYDLWGTAYAPVAATVEGTRLRDAVRAADNAGLPEARAIFTNSRVVGDRLRSFNGLDSQVLYPPLGDAAGFRCEPAGNSIVYVSRIAHHKRQGLLAASMAHVSGDVRLVLAGAPDDPQALADLHAQIERAEVGDRVTVLARWISEEEKRELVAGALACAYIPFEEDSYGYPSLEAAHARKAILTCSDSGGTLELIRDGVNGVVAQPTPRSIASAIDRLAGDREATRRMGEAAGGRLDALGISWDHVVERLLA